MTPRCAARRACADSWQCALQSRNAEETAKRACPCARSLTVGRLWHKQLSGSVAGGCAHGAGQRAASPLSDTNKALQACLHLNQHAQPHPPMIQVVVVVLPTDTTTRARWRRQHSNHVSASVALDGRRMSHRSSNTARYAAISRPEHATKREIAAHTERWGTSAAAVAAGVSLT